MLIVLDASCFQSNSIGLPFIMEVLNTFDSSYLLWLNCRFDDPYFNLFD